VAYKSFFVYKLLTFLLEVLSTMTSKKKLELLWSNKDSLERKMHIAQSVVESCWYRVMKGADLYQDIEEEQMRVESNLKILMREIVNI